MTALCGAEMRLRVKEHVVKKKNSHELPKNIRQVGDLDLDKRVYIEDYAFSFVRELTLDEDEEGRVGILLGEEKKIDGRITPLSMGQWKSRMLPSMTAR